MNLRDLIISGQSKRDTEAAVHFIGNDKDRFNELINYCFAADTLLSRQACRIASDVTTNYPRLVQTHIPKIVRQLVSPEVDPAVKRHILKVLQKSPIPVSSQGILMNFCFEVVTSFEEAPAVKANALTVLYNLSKKHPEILGELILLINDRLATESPAFRSRAIKILTEQQKN